MKFKTILNKLIHQHNSPHEIALGAGIGAFICVLPVYGLHTLLAILAAAVVRPANKMAILLGTSISLPPTVPFITWFGYEIGRLIFCPELAHLDREFFRKLTLQKVIDCYWPLFWGSAILGIFCAGIVYTITFFVVKKIKARNANLCGNKNQKI